MRKQGMNSWFGMCASELRVNAGRAHPLAPAEKTEHVQTVSDRSPAIAHPVPLSDNRGYTCKLTVPYSSHTVCHLDGRAVLDRIGVSDIGDVLGKWTRASEIARQPTIAAITEWILRNHAKAQEKSLYVKKVPSPFAGAGYPGDHLIGISDSTSAKAEVGVGARALLSENFLQNFCGGGEGPGPRSPKGVFDPSPEGRVEPTEPTVTATIITIAGVKDGKVGNWRAGIAPR